MTELFSHDRVHTSSLIYGLFCSKLALKKNHILVFKDYFAISEYRIPYVKDRRYMAVKYCRYNVKNYSINQSVVVRISILYSLK